MIDKNKYIYKPNVFQFFDNLKVIKVKMIDNGIKKD